MTIGLFITLVYSQVIYQFAMIYQQRQAKREMKQEIRRSIRESDLEIIAYLDHEKEIEWEEDGREFRLYGEMYDVVKSDTVGGKPVLYCINDKKENELIHKYLNSFKQKNSADKKPTNNSIKLLINQSPEIIVISHRAAPVYEVLPESSLPFIEREQLIPPPKV